MPESGGGGGREAVVWDRGRVFRERGVQRRHPLRVRHRLRLRGGHGGPWRRISRRQDGINRRRTLRRGGDQHRVGFRFWRHRRDDRGRRRATAEQQRCAEQRYEGDGATG